MTVTTPTAPAPTTPTGSVGQVLLPGQAAAPDGPVDLTVMFVMHHAFRRDLSAFASAVPRTPVSDRRAGRGLAERWQLFSGVLHHHHSGEDAGLWPLLLERVDAAGDLHGRRTLEAMEAEHADIDPLLEVCAAGFARLAEAPDSDERAALAVRLVAAREQLARHLRHEESEALVLVQRLMTQEDWDRMEDEHFKGKGSLRELVAMLGWVGHELPEQAVMALRRNPKLRPVLVLARLCSPRFARRERRIFPASRCSGAPARTR